MKKILGILLVFCFLLYPMFTNAETVEKIDLTKYKTLNLKEALASEEIKEEFKNYSEKDDQITIYLFRGQGCGYCKSFLTFLNGITNEYGKYFKLVSFESWNDEANSNLLQTISTFANNPAQGVPYIIIGDQVFPGYASSYDDQIKTAIKQLYDSNERYDIFEAYNDSINKASKEANASTNKVIIWNFVFITIATVVIMLYVKNLFKKYLVQPNVTSNMAIKIDNDIVKESTKKVTKTSKSKK